MGIKVSGNGGADFELPGPGVHRAICIQIYDIGLQAGFKPEDRPKEQVVVLWELEERDSRGQRFTMPKFYTQSIHEKSNLGKDLVSWRGRPFTEAELADFDLDAIKGKPCQLNLVPTDAGKIKVQTVMFPQTMVLADGKRHIAEHWKPETPAIWVPPYVTKAIEKQLIKPAKAAPAPQPAPQPIKGTFVERTAPDGFVDQIPFD